MFVRRDAQERLKELEKGQAPDKPVKGKPGPDKF